MLLVPLLCGCGQSAPDERVRTAEAFVDAFYSWDAQRLGGLLTPGEDADAVLYYQRWAEAAHYQVQHRQPCRVADDDLIRCAITVVDDFGTALGYTATDTFTLTVADGAVTSVSFAGDDPPVFQALFDWLAETRPEVLSGPCRDLFAGGTTPGDCARAVAQGARDFVAR